MSRIISVDEAIKMLQEYKRNVSDTILISVFDDKSKISSYPFKKDVKYGIKLVIDSDADIIYNNSFLKSLYTRNGTKRKTIIMSI